MITLYFIALCCVRLLLLVWSIVYFSIVYIIFPSSWYIGVHISKNIWHTKALYKAVWCNMILTVHIVLIEEKLQGCDVCLFSFSSKLLDTPHWINSILAIRLVRYCEENSSSGTRGRDLAGYREEWEVAPKASCIVLKTICNTRRFVSWNQVISKGLSYILEPSTHKPLSHEPSVWGYWNCHQYHYLQTNLEYNVRVRRRDMIGWYAVFTIGRGMHTVYTVCNVDKVIR